MKLSNAAAIFGANFDQIESLGLQIINQAIDPADEENQKLEELAEVFQLLEQQKDFALRNRNRKQALLAVFGLIGIGSILQKVIDEVLTEEESQNG